MPSRSPEQAKTMAAIAHGWKPPASSGIHIPVSVATEFNQADKGSGIRKKKFRRGGKIRPSEHGLEMMRS